MGNVLDLRPLLKATFELVLNENETLHLFKPTEPMLRRIAAMDESHKKGKSNVLKDLNLINSLVKEVIDQNAEHQEAELAWVQSLPLDVKMAVIEEYCKWAMQYDSPNSSAPPSPAAT